MLTDYDRTEFVYWAILAVGVVIAMLLCFLFVLVALRRSRVQEVTHSRLARILYLAGAELGLLPMLAAYLASKLRARHLFPAQLSPPTLRWVDVVFFGVVILIGLVWGLGLYVDWRFTRQHGRN